MDGRGKKQLHPKVHGGISWSSVTSTARHEKNIGIEEIGYGLWLTISIRSHQLNAPDCDLPWRLKTDIGGPTMFRLCGEKP